MNRHNKDEGLLDRAAKALQGDLAQGLVAAYAFGSRAEGRAHKESDLDVGVLLAAERFATRRDRFVRSLEIAAALAAELGLPDIDVVVLNDAPPTLARRIVLDGVRLSCTDTERAHAFVRDTQLRAADLEPFLRRMQAIKLAAIAPR